MAREGIVRAAKALDALGFMPGKSGNVSCRTPGGFLDHAVRPALRGDEAGDLVEVAADGAVLDGGRRPSSEWRLHAAVYAARPERGRWSTRTARWRPRCPARARASRPSTTWSRWRAGRRALRPYATFGTEALAANCVPRWKAGRAALLANHGVVAFGATLAAARALAEEVENLARQYLALRARGWRRCC
jgi:L-fuculose-phosphate aldolase